MEYLSHHLAMLCPRIHLQPDSNKSQHDGRAHTAAYIKRQPPKRIFSMSGDHQTGVGSPHSAIHPADGATQPLSQAGNWQQSQHPDVSQQWNAYGPVNMTGGTLYQGGPFLVNTEDIKRKEAEVFIGSLRFPDINLRVNQIVDSHHETFRWALDSGSVNDAQPDSDSRSEREDAEARSGQPNSRTVSFQPGTFGAWLTTDEPLFWVAGKPGSGKSTLMKFLSTHDKSLSLLSQKFQNQDVQIIRFFFWLHGSEMQRTIKGCLCTLLYQLLYRDRELVTITLQKNVGLHSKFSPSDWSESELRHLLLDLLSSGSHAYGVFLDGLDEHDKRLDTRELLALVRNLSELGNVKLCVSSRQENSYERAFLRVSKLRLQDLTYNGMYAIARAKMKTELEEAEVSLPGSQLDHLGHELAQRAEGVFLWAVVAIRVMTTSIRNGDDYKDLLVGLQGLPTEFEELCHRILANVNASGQNTLETSFRYLTIAKYQPISLLTFTLATDEQALRRITKTSASLTIADMQWLLQACVRTESKIRACTTGLLEVVANDFRMEKQDEADLSKEFEHEDDVEAADQRNPISGEIGFKYGLCTCPDTLRRQPRCFSSLPYVDEFRQIHSKEVRYMHRDVAEVLGSMNTRGLKIARESELRLESQKRFLIASCLQKDLGCFCRHGETVEHLCRVLAGLGQVHGPVVVDQYIGSVTTRSLSSGRHPCYYGSTHQIFNASEREGIPYGFLNHSADRAIYDLHGLLARLGLLNTTAAVPLWSSYYKGYLLACALKGEYSHHAQCRERYLGRSRVALWLLRHGADSLSPRLSYTAFGMLPAQTWEYSNELLMLRSSIVVGWCFILRLLDEPQVSREEKLQICNTLVPVFLAPRCCLEDLTVWSLRVDIPVEQPSGIFPHDSDVLMLQFVMKTSIQKLQLYALSSIWFLQEGHQHGRQAPIFDAEDVSLLFWCQSHGRFGFQVDTVQDESFGRLLGTALRAFLCREAVESQSTKPLVQKLQEYPSQSQHEILFPDGGHAHRDFLRIVKPLRTPPHHSFYILPVSERYPRLKIVPPDPKMELEHGQWYEHGALREWHERRRRKMWSTIPRYQRLINEYEATYPGIRPSYLQPLRDVGGTPRQSSGQKRKNSDSRCDDPQDSANCSSNKPQRRTHEERSDPAQNSQHCSPSGRILPDSDDMTTDIGGGVGASLSLDWVLSPPSYQQANRYNRSWE